MPELIQYKLESLRPHIRHQFARPSALFASGKNTAPSVVSPVFNFVCTSAIAEAAAPPSTSMTRTSASADCLRCS